MAELLHAIWTISVGGATLVGGLVAVVYVILLVAALLMMLFGDTGEDRRNAFAVALALLALGLICGGLWVLGNYVLLAA